MHKLNHQDVHFQAGTHQGQFQTPSIHSEQRIPVLSCRHHCGWQLNPKACKINLILMQYLFSSCTQSTLKVTHGTVVGDVPRKATTSEAGMPTWGFMSQQSLPKQRSAAELQQVLAYGPSSWHPDTHESLAGSYSVNLPISHSIYLSIYLHVQIVSTYLSL